MFVPRALLGTAALLAAGSVLSGCTGAPKVSLGQEVVPPASSASSTAAEPITFAYTGAAQTVTVPGGATAVDVFIAGAEGGQGGKKGKVLGRPGRGIRLHVMVPVTQGSELTIGVGGRGGVAQGDRGPGSPGWALDDHNGGAGGHSKGSAVDGSGGGGASILKADGTVRVIAGGGGGQTTGDDADLIGGDAGLTAGRDSQGDRMNTAVNGLGGSASNPNLPKNGEDARSQIVKFAGAGGGGGYHNGGGGKVGSGMKGGSGGGGDSFLATDVALVEAPTLTTGNGAATLTWIF